jgi:N-acetylmuramoyl-L-alanine amidase
MVDAGHGGYDNGASYNGRKEKDDTLRLAMAVGEELKNRGFDVSFTRTTDVYQNPNEKVQIANDSGVDYFLSIHRNSSPDNNAYSGAETLIYNKGDIKEQFAENINQELEKVGYNNLGVEERTNIAVLRYTKMPSFLTEVGFINTDYDNQVFDDRFSDIAKAIADGILKTVQSEQKPPYRYRIQVGLFRNIINAQNLQARLIADGFGADIVPMGEFYSVLVGNFNSIDQANQLEKELDSKGYETLVIAV